MIPICLADNCGEEAHYAISYRRIPDHCFFHRKQDMILISEKEIIALPLFIDIYCNDEEETEDDSDENEDDNNDNDSENEEEIYCIPLQD